MLRRRFLMYLVNSLTPLFASMKATVKAWVKRVSKLSQAPAETIKADSKISVDTESPLTQKPGEEIKVDSKISVMKYVLLNAYIKASPVFHSRIYTKVKAGLITAVGKVGKKTTVLYLTCKKKATYGMGALVSAISAFTAKHTAKAAYGNGVIAKITSVFRNGKTATVTHGNGEGITSYNAAPISVIASAENADTISANIKSSVNIRSIAQLITWVYPTLDGDKITFYQVFSGIQNGNTLEIDLETESAYFALPTVSGGTLNLVFANEATETEKVIEVI